jgi:hypothetical protein
MFRSVSSAVSGLLALTVLVSPAVAQGFDSAYTSLDLDQCRLIETDDYGGASWSCPGYGNIPVTVQEGDLRFSIQYGDDDSPGSQTLSPFNNLGPTLEWRLSDETGRWQPIATIVRYHTADIDTGENSGQVLVVTQLEPGNTCHMAYVDARANRNANVLARRAADRAGSFDCYNDEVEIVGRFAAY